MTMTFLLENYHPFSGSGLSWGKFELVIKITPESDGDIVAQVVNFSLL